MFEDCGELQTSEVSWVGEGAGCDGEEELAWRMRRAKGKGGDSVLNRRGDEVSAQKQTSKQESCNYHKYR